MRTALVHWLDSAYTYEGGDGLYRPMPMETVGVVLEDSTECLVLAMDRTLRADHPEPYRSILSIPRGCVVEVLDLVATPQEMVATPDDLVATPQEMVATPDDLVATP